MIGPSSVDENATVDVEGSSVVLASSTVVDAAEVEDVVVRCGTVVVAGSVGGEAVCFVAFATLPIEARTAMTAIVITHHRLHHGVGGKGGGT